MRVFALPAEEITEPGANFNTFRVCFFLTATRLQLVAGGISDSNVFVTSKVSSLCFHPRTDLHFCRLNLVFLSHPRCSIPFFQSKLSKSDYLLNTRLFIKPTINL